MRTYETCHGRCFACLCNAHSFTVHSNVWLQQIMFINMASDIGLIELPCYYVDKFEKVPFFVESKRSDCLQTLSTKKKYYLKIQKIQRVHSETSFRTYPTRCAFAHRASWSWLPPSLARSVAARMQLVWKPLEAADPLF